MARIKTEWEGPDIVSVNQDKYVLKLGQMLLAFLLVLTIFGMSLMVFGVEFIRPKTMLGHSFSFCKKEGKVDCRTKVLKESQTIRRRLSAKAKVKRLHQAMLKSTENLKCSKAFDDARHNITHHT